MGMAQQLVNGVLNILDAPSGNPSATTQSAMPIPERPIPQEDRSSGRMLHSLAKFGSQASCATDLTLAKSLPGEHRARLT
jgi:hypothetical protein